MKDRNNLFKKYFSIYAVTLLIGTSLLGVVLLYFASQYFRNVNRERLIGAVEMGIETAARGIERNGGFLVRSEVAEEFSLTLRLSGISVFLSDVDGRVQICGDAPGCAHTGVSVPSAVRERLAVHGEYFDAGYLGGFFEDGGRYTYGRTLTIGGVIYGYVFASTSLVELFDFLYQVTLMFLFASLVTLTVSFFIIYYATRILTRPLSEIGGAAKAFGEGDFSARVTVTGNDEIGRLGEVFNRMADSVSALETIRRNFIANVSHELRTPMTTIAGYIDGILDGTIPRGDQDRYLDIVTNEVKRLARLTSSMLDIARMEAGEQTANIVSHNIWDIILGVMWNAERRIEEKGIEIAEMDVEARFVLCDPDMTHQVIYNILDNAIKFTPEAGKISVSVGEGHDGFTDVSIRNSGGGIAEEDIGRVFERFYKTDKSRGLDKTGTGLGLYIVKTLLSRMDGTISANSRQGEYAEFVISFRNGQPPAASKSDARRGAGSGNERDREKAGFVEKLTRGFRKEDGQKDVRGR